MSESIAFPTNAPAPIDPKRPVRGLGEWLNYLGFMVLGYSAAREFILGIVLKESLTAPIADPRKHGDEDYDPAHPVAKLVAGKVREWNGNTVGEKVADEALPKLANYAEVISNCITTVEPFVHGIHTHLTGLGKDPAVWETKLATTLRTLTRRIELDKFSLAQETFSEPDDFVISSKAVKAELSAFMQDLSPMVDDLACVAQVIVNSSSELADLKKALNLALEHAIMAIEANPKIFKDKKPDSPNYLNVQGINSLAACLNLGPIIEKEFRPVEGRTKPDRYLHFHAPNPKEMPPVKMHVWGGLCPYPTKETVVRVLDYLRAWQLKLADIHPEKMKLPDDTKEQTHDESQKMNDSDDSRNAQGNKRPRCVPMTRTEIARRLLNKSEARVREAEGLMNRHDLRQEHGKLYTIAVDKLEPLAKERLMKSNS